MTFFEGNTWHSLIIRNKIADELLKRFFQRNPVKTKPRFLLGPIEVAGLAIGRSVDDLRKILGAPASVRSDSKAGDNISAYPCGEAVLSFWVRSSVVYGITVTKAVPA
jgi:hypothetical protein